MYIGLHGLQVQVKLTVTAQYCCKRGKLPLYAVNGSGPNFQRCCWLKLLDIQIPRLNAIYKILLNLEHILQKHAAVFQLGLSELKGTKVHLSMKPDISPTFCKHAQYIMHCEKKSTRKSIASSRKAYSNL